MSARPAACEGRRRTRKVLFKGFALALAFLGMALFAKGFLQVRKMIEKRSQCSQRPATNLLFPTLHGGGCWVARPHRKLVIIVIDALRIDFVLPPKVSSHPSPAAPGYLGHLTILDELVRNEPLNAHLFHFIADPPTATTQRLTGLMAGSLPAFIEVTSNFAESSIGTDNVIHQLLKNHRKKLDLLGDDTWLHLFPEIQQASTGLIAGFHSFHLFDLDSVDDGIIKHLFPRLEGGDYDVLVAHFLGVDHCGHKYGPAHPHCGGKLKQMDDVIRKIISTMDGNTQLIILSDHGMTDNGDHGGISEKEVGSMLFSYQKLAVDEGDLPGEERKFWLEFRQAFDERRAKGNNFDRSTFFGKVCDFSSVVGTVPQIDFASTLSLLAGVPIPFGNIGSIIPELLIDFGLYRDHEPEVARLTNLRSLLEALRLNALQVNQLLLTSSDLGQAGFGQSNLRFLLEMIRSLEERSTNSVSANEGELLSLIHGYYDYLIACQSYCRRIWANFDMPLIVTGLILGISAVLGLLVYFLAQGGATEGGNLLCILMPLMHSLSLTATSFVTFEDTVVRFLLTTQLLAEAVSAFSAGHFSLRRAAQIAMAILLIRISSETGACREEQYPHCQVTTHRAVPVALTPSFLYYLSVGILGILWVTKQTHESLEEFKGTAKHIIGHLLYFMIFILLSLHWLWTWMADTPRSTERSGSGASVAYPALLDHMLSITLPRALFLLSFLTAVIYRRDGALLVTAVSAFVGTVLRPFGGWITLIAGVGLLRLSSRIFNYSSGSIKPAVFYYLVGTHLFFVSGHQMTLTNLQWEAAFVGVRTTIQSLAAILMILNTFAGPIVATMSICSQVNSFDLPAGTLSVYLWYASCQMILAALATAILMRHLMVWKMFTPRFLLQATQSLLILLIVGMHKLFGRRMSTT